MELNSLFGWILALLGVLLVLVLVVIVVMLRLPRLLRRRRPAADPPRRVLEEEGGAGSAGARQKLSELKAEAVRLREGARREADEVRLEAERLRVEAREVLAVQTENLGRQREELDLRAGELASLENQLSSGRREAEDRDERLTRREQDLERRLAELEKAQAGVEAERERLAGLSAADARAELLSRVEHDARLAAFALARDVEADARANAESRARRIIVESMQRLAAEQTTESTVTTVALPSEDMKGRIIGREGRNIRSFELVTGVNVMVDDTPETVLLSSFDPVRREAARLTLVDLIADGRIHPARIEQVHARSEQRIADRCQRAGEDALAAMGITDLHPELVPIVGALQYRTSYGQNVLKHLLECGHLAAMMAAELGLDPEVCRRAAFLHDIGKALTHEVQGSHAHVGAELARKYGESADVVHAIEAHHNEVEPRTVEAVLTQAADAVSGARPGARRESLELYVKRLDKLERLASDHKGVDKVFAMHAGREIRVMVSPEELSDAETHALARDIARQLEAELSYPGTIKVTVVRESRATDIAH